MRRVHGHFDSGTLPGRRWTLRRCAASALAVLALAAPARAAPDLARAEAIVQGRCFVCHGIGGESASPLFPRLAGQHAAYVARQLADYQSGRRSSSTMQAMVAGLDSAELLALGAYFASQPTARQAVEDAALAERGRAVYQRAGAASGAAACTSCHGADAHGSDTLPRLAGQHARYIENQLRQFSRGARSHPVMQAVAGTLTDAELQAVAVYLSSLP
jgi:cytochrome c553